MPSLSDRDFARLATDLEWILCDVDGVLTDGSIGFGSRGEALKFFHVRDGLGLKLAQRAGLKVGVLTARSSAIAARRAADLGLDAVLTGHRDKRAGFDLFLARHGATARRVAYIGDDLTDLLVLARAGLAFAPADAAEEVRAVADCVLAAPGGRGAVRQMVEMILKARGEWERILSGFTFEE